MAAGEAQILNATARNRLARRGILLQQIQCLTTLPLSARRAWLAATCASLFLPTCSRRCCCTSTKPRLQSARPLFFHCSSAVIFYDAQKPRADGTKEGGSLITGLLSFLRTKPHPRPRATSRHLYRKPLSTRNTKVAINSPSVKASLTLLVSTASCRLPQDSSLADRGPLPGSENLTQPGYRETVSNV